MTRRSSAGLTALLVLACTAVHAQGISLATIPDTVPPEIRGQLSNARAVLEMRIDDHNRRVRDFRTRCEGILQTDPRMAACGQEFRGMRAEQDTLEADKQQFASRVAMAAIVVTDPMTVDARVERAGADWVAKIPELARSPAADRIAKGFAAVINHDWPVALAWWQDALNRDPTNLPLRRGVDLAQWTIAYRQLQTNNAAELRRERAELDRLFDDMYRQNIIRVGRQMTEDLRQQRSRQFADERLLNELKAELDQMIKDEDAARR